MPLRATCRERTDFCKFFRILQVATRTLAISYRWTADGARMWVLFANPRLWYIVMRPWYWPFSRKGQGMLSPETTVLDATALNPTVSTPTVLDDGVSRREFLCVGGLGLLGASLAEGAQLGPSTVARRRAIFILMSGGPSQLDTFDPKPEAPSQFRGPMRAIPTRVPGLWLSDALPHLADRADQFALIRSLNHDYAPIHETGQQLLQCGRVVEQGVRFPHFGAVVAKTYQRPVSSRANVVLPRVLHETGTHHERGQSAGCWGSEWNPAEVALQSSPQESTAIRRAYGDTHFGRLLLQARQQIEAGSRCVTVNLFDTLHQRVTWDCHGDVSCGPGTVFDYRDTLCPQFDQALAALLDDLGQRGLLDDTLVVATGEFGRTPRINEHSGRDHWPGCWSALVAGGRVRGGAVIGASDAIGSSPIDRPVSPAELNATLLGWFGIDGRGIEIPIGKSHGPLVPADPIYELWS